jgi:hypothetical protein
MITPWPTRADVKMIWAQCDKTLYIRNLRLFVKISVCPGKPLRSSLMFVVILSAFRKEDLPLGAPLG